MMSADNVPIEKLMNIGLACCAWLRPLGIRTKQDLHAWPFADLYKAVKQRIPYCNAVFLYAVAGALMDTHWNDIPPDMKKELRGVAARINQELKK